MRFLRYHLEFPTTRKLILSFDRGMTASLLKLPSIDTKGREYFYIYLFVVGATVFSLIIGYLLRDSRA